MKRIVLVDDNEGFRRPLSSMLERAGHEVIGLSDGEAALCCCRSQHVDLLITDLIMPGKEGIETIIELRRSHPHLKIIAISGGGRVHAGDYLQMARSLGATETLAKPFTSERVLTLVRSMLA